MIWNLSIDPIKFWLVLARLSGFAVVSPGIRDIPAPRVCKAVLVAWLTLAMVPTIGGLNQPVFQFDVLFFDIVGEFFVGFSLGMVLRLIFAGVELGGSILDSEMGFLAAQQMGLPTFDGGALQRWIVWVALFYFWVLDYFSVAILAVNRSFFLLPLAAFRMAGKDPENLVHLGASLFVSGITIAAPIVALMFVINIGFGLAARAIQGIPLFYESFTLRVLVGWGAVIFFMPLILLGVRNRLEAMIPALTQQLAIFRIS